MKGINCSLVALIQDYLASQLSLQLGKTTQPEDFLFMVRFFTVPDLDYLYG